MSQIRNQTIQGLTVGKTFTVSRKFTEQDMITFADITRDYNPIHFDERFVAAKNLKGRICHGLLVGSLLTEIGGQIGWLASEMNFRFKKPVYFGDTIECSLTITKIDGLNRPEQRQFIATRTEPSFWKPNWRASSRMTANGRSSRPFWREKKGI